MTAASRPTRRVLITGSATALAAGAVTRAVPVGAIQADRALLDLLLTQEQIQIAHYTAMLAAFDDAAFNAAGLPENTRSTIESILMAEEAHLAVVSRPGGESSAAPPAPVPVDLLEAMQEAAELENLAVAAYALVIPEVDRQRLIPELIGIHSVEARHAAWLATLLGTVPFPNAIDAALVLGQASNEPAAPVLASPVAGTPVTSREMAPILAAIAEDLGTSVDSLQLISVESRTWPDSSLGCPQPDMLYAQVITTGYLVLLEVAGEQVEYHADKRGNVVRCSGS